MALLLDANVLIALLAPDHEDHIAATEWFVHINERFATYPITEGSLLRALLRDGHPTDRAWNALTVLRQHPVTSSGRMIARMSRYRSNASAGIAR